MRPHQCANTRGGLAPGQGPRDSLQRRCICHALFCQARRGLESSLPARPSPSVPGAARSHLQTRNICHHVPIHAAAILVPAKSTSPSSLTQRQSASAALIAELVSPASTASPWSKSSPRLLPVRSTEYPGLVQAGLDTCLCLSPRSHQRSSALSLDAETRLKRTKTQPSAPDLPSSMSNGSFSSPSGRHPSHQNQKHHPSDLEANLLELGLLGNRHRKKSTRAPAKTKPKIVEFGSPVAHHSTCTHFFLRPCLHCAQTRSCLF